MMTANTPFFSHLARHSVRFAGLIGLMLALVLTARAVLVAQVAGDRGIAPVAATGDIDVMGVDVDVAGKNAEDARSQGWQVAIREGWAKLGGPALNDSQLRGMVSTIIVQREQLGPRRYVATLGIVFDRARSGQMLGAGGPRSRSAPLLLIPVLQEGGTQTVFETRNAWQRVWAEFQAGASAIDYVRPSGAGGDSLLVTYGQTSRRSRLWWRNVLDQFGAADVLVAIAHLEREWPGGPVTGNFTARYGPDSTYLESFTLRVDGEAGVPQMLGKAVDHFNTIFTRALSDGKLRPDPTLRTELPRIDPALAELVAIGRRAEAADKVITDAIIGTPATSPARTGQSQTAVSSYTVQFTTPDAASVDAGLAAVRGVAGVRSAASSSLALGGVSVMTVNYAGSLSDLASALRARGWQVVQGNNALSISK